MENENYSGVLPSTTSSDKLSGASAPLAQSESVPSLSKMEAKAEEPGQVKYVKESEAKNGEAAVEIGPVETTFAGMNKEELMKYANDPFWVGLRWFLFILFWVAWFAMLGGAIAIIVLAPRCATREEWQKSPLYQVYPRSFQDSDGDGSGDLNGIKSRLDHFSDLGVKFAWFAPIYKSPMKSSGYDVSDFTEIDQTFGTMQEFEELLSEMKSKGLKLVLDLVPNHSSDEHPWFKESINKTNTFADYYIWRPPKMVNGVRTEPNNWVSLNGGSAWEWNDKRQEYYLHQFSKNQPDLNYHNPQVKEELKKIVRFWLDKGVEGFRMQGVSYLFEDPEFRDEPPAASTNNAKAGEYASLDHIYTSNLPEVFDLVAEIRSVLNEFENSDKRHRVLFTDANISVDELINYYGNSSGSLADFPLNFDLIAATKNDVTGFQLNSTISSFLRNVPEWGWANWMLGNPDNQRLATRVGSGLLDALAMVQMLLPGTPVMYYGEEIGMADYPAGAGQFDANSARTPMQWSSSANAGFSNASQTWLPVNPNYVTVNVDEQKIANESHFKVYQALIKERLSVPILHGDTIFAEVSESIFSFMRFHAGSTPGYLVVINVGNRPEIVDFSRFTEINSDLEVLIRSVGSPVEIGAKIAKNEVSIEAEQGLVLTFTPVSK